MDPVVYPIRIDTDFRRQYQLFVYIIKDELELTVFPLLKRLNSGVLHESMIPT